MAKDLTNPNKLGFLRVLQVCFAFNIVVTMSSLVFVVKESYVIGPSEILVLLNLISGGISFWLIWQRKHAARVFIITVTFLNIAAGVVFHLATSNSSLLIQLLLSSFDIAILLYFFTSKRVRAVLIQPFSLEIKTGELQKQANYYQPKTWPFWRNIIIYFCVFSVVGHWMEAAYCTLIRFGMLPGTYDPNSQIWSDWLYPFVVYGVGAVACVLLLFPLKNFLETKFSKPFIPITLSFIANALVCTLIELIMGLMLNQPSADGTMPLWNYSDMFCNFMGQVCLQNAIAFGIAATFMTWVIYPGLESLLARLSRDTMNVMFIAVAISFCILFFFYCVNILLPDFSNDEFNSVDTSQIDYGANTPIEKTL